MSRFTKFNPGRGLHFTHNSLFPMLQWSRSKAGENFEDYLITGMFPAKYVTLTTYTNHILIMCMIKKNDVKKDI